MKLHRVRQTISNRERSLISPFLTQFLILGEDHRFFSHCGVDCFAICRAIWRLLFWHIREGASTIEMQTVRVLTGRYELTLQRKIREILLATLLTEEVSKIDIPNIYLHIAYYGWRMNGLGQACNYLNLLPQTLTAKEAAKLVARLKYPEPRMISYRRTKQIEFRTRHLIWLSRPCTQRFNGILRRLNIYATI